MFNAPNIGILRLDLLYVAFCINEMKIYRVTVLVPTKFIQLPSSSMIISK